MEIKDLNTMSLVSDFESSLLAFARKHAQMIKSNLEAVRRIESNFFNSMSEIDTRYSQETTQANNSAETTINDAITSYNRSVTQADKEFEYAKEQIVTQYNDRISATEAEYHHRTAYARKISEIYSDYIAFFTMNSEYLRTKLHESHLIWFEKYTTRNLYLSYANKNYDSIFSKDDVDMSYIHEELIELVRFVVSYEKLGMMKRMSQKSELLSVLGNIDALLRSLHQYKTELQESFCKHYFNDEMPKLKKEADDKKNAALSEAEKSLQENKKAALGKRDKIIAETKANLQPSLDAIKQRLATEKAQLSAELEKNKKQNEESFVERENELKEDILLCLNTKFSAKIIGELNKVHSHIDNYSDTEIYKPVEENNPYVRLGYVQFDYSNHPEMRSDLFLQDILNQYYEKLNTFGIFRVPYIIDFRCFSNVQLVCENDDVINATSAVRSIVTRLFCNMLAGRVKFTFFDLAAQGQTFAPFMQFISASPTSRNIVNQGTCTDVARAENLLESLENTVRDINANIYTKDYSSVIEYNEVSEPNVLPINIIVVMNYPEQLSDEAIARIERIVRHSKRCGFHFLFVGSGRSESFSQFSISDILNDVQSQSAEIISFEKLDPLFCKMKYINTYEYQLESSSVTVRFEEMLKEDKLAKISNSMIESLEKSSSIKVSYNKINLGFSAKSAKEDIRLPFALVGSSDIKSLIFGDKYAGYAAVVGVPRSGKSNAIHVLIMSAMCNYSPEELQLYLLDYKLGVEAYRYSEYRLPHFRVISTTKNAIFGLNVISSIDDIMEERTSLFTANGCVNYTEYRNIRQNNPELELPALPRLLVIIDEVHAMINVKGDKDDNFSERMARLIKTSPSYGIHMILASQTVTDWNFGESFDLITSAVAFKCAPESEKKLLGQDSAVAQQIPTSEPGHAIYSADRQNPNNNQYVRVGYLETDAETKLLKQIEDMYKTYDCSTRINASSLINRADNPVYKLVNGIKTEFVSDMFTIGENLDLDELSDIKLAGNLMMIGDNQEMARNFTETLLISVLCSNIVNHTSNEIFFIDLTEFASISKMNKDLIYKLSQDIGESHLKYFACNHVEEAIATTCQAAVTASQLAKSYIFIFGLSDAQQELLTSLLSKGNPNAHIIVWCNTYECFSNCLALDYHKMMIHRLVFCSSENDVKQLTSRARDLTGSNYALYRDISSPLTAKEYAPYKNTNDRWLEELIAILKNCSAENAVS